MATLTTERLLLRPFRTSDAPSVAAYATREVFWRYLPLEPLTVETSDKYVGDRVAGGMPDAEGTWTFAVERHEGGPMIGALSITVRGKARHSASLGYGLDPDWWGKGIATEGMRTVLAFGFGTLGVHRIFATADVHNERSWRVMERLGMRREGILRGDKLVRGEWRDSVLYAILAEEFAALR